ncbi:MAG: hypothetical protein P8103_06565 [Candidatus Thiodiazotropha sp.]
MSRRFIQETFFRPAELEREVLTIPAPLYNRCRLLHARSELPHLFVPIRSMQFLAIVDRREIIFVDHQGGYAVQDGEGGRLIVLAWQFAADEPRASINEPVPITLVHYREDVRALHRRIMSEFPPALERLVEKLAGAEDAGGEGRILPFRTSKN